MSRSRNIKPGFFKNEYLAELEPLDRLLFIALWCEADREGRLEDRPARIKAEYFPYDNCDISTMLARCEHSAGNFLIRYEVDGKRYIQITNFKKHQNPHIKEQPSIIPPPQKHDDKPLENKESGAYTIFAQCKHRTCMVLAGLIPDSGFLIPDSPSPDSGVINNDSMTVGELRQEYEQRTRRRINSGSEITVLQDLARDFTRNALMQGLEETCTNKPDRPLPYLVKVLRNKEPPQPDLPADSEFMKMVAEERGAHGP